MMLFGVQLNATKSPHGDKLKIDCTVCHVTENWNKIKHDGFNHNKTRFPLKGQHNAVSCKKCHPTLVFDKTPTECNACHTDMHEGTVGKDCGRCHNQNSWIVTNIRKIHQQAGFPLTGEHAAADCNRCHTSASLLRFNNIRSDCYSCHQTQYELTTKPNHKATGMGTDCQRCHNMAGQSWLSIGHGFDHSLFTPLIGRHLTANCSGCHFDISQGIYKRGPINDCKECHGPEKSNIIAHKNPSWQNCTDCHTPIGWENVKYPQHDGLYGRIYSGTHKGKWSACSDCHQNTPNYTSSCSKCHNFNSGRLP